VLTSIGIKLIEGPDMSWIV